jgi:hypothetical protein
MSDSTPFEIHNKLLSDLITDYLDSSRKDERERNFTKWKLAFRNINSSPYHQTCPILQDLYYLENTGRLGIGKYDILSCLMSDIGHAVNRIKQAEQKIEAVKKEQGNKTLGDAF